MESAHSEEELTMQGIYWKLLNQRPLQTPDLRCYGSPRRVDQGGGEYIVREFRVESNGTEHFKVGAAHKSISCQRQLQRIP